MEQSEELKRLLVDASYIGDGAYVTLGASAIEIIVFTSNGIDVQNQIHLDLVNLTLISDFYHLHNNDVL